jgi:hypothetical protein
VWVLDMAVSQIPTLSGTQRMQCFVCHCDEPALATLTLTLALTLALPVPSPSAHPAHSQVAQAAAAALAARPYVTAAGVALPALAPGGVLAPGSVYNPATGE